MEVVLIAVISLDGRITLPGQSGPGFASPEDKAWFQRSLDWCDCSVMGRATFDTIPAAMLARGKTRIVMTRYRPDEGTPPALPPGVQRTDAAPAAILESLRARGFKRCAILGGGQVSRHFVEAGLVDALWITLEPVLLGGGTPFIDSPIPPAAFAFAGMHVLGSHTLLLNYQRIGGSSIAPPLS